MVRAAMLRVAPPLNDGEDITQAAWIAGIRLQYLNSEVIPHLYRGTELIAITLPPPKDSSSAFSVPFLVVDEVWMNESQMRFNVEHYRRLHAVDVGPDFRGEGWSNWQLKKTEAGAWRFRQEGTTFSHGKCVEYSYTMPPKMVWGAAVKIPPLQFGFGCFPLAPLGPTRGSAMQITAPAYLVLTTEPRYTIIHHDQKNNTETFEIPLNPPGADFSFLDIYRFFQFPYTVGVVMLGSDMRTQFAATCVRAVWSRWAAGLAVTIGFFIGVSCGRQCK